MQKPRKTISQSMLTRMALTNAYDLPLAIERQGFRYEWGGFGWVNCGTPTGREVLVLEEHEKPPLFDKRTKRPFCQVCRQHKSGTHFQWRLQSPYSICRPCRKAKRAQKRQRQNKRKDY